MLGVSLIVLLSLHFKTLIHEHVMWRLVNYAISEDLGRFNLKTRWGEKKEFGMLEEVNFSNMNDPLEKFKTYDQVLASTMRSYIKILAIYLLFQPVKFPLFVIF